MLTHLSIRDVVLIDSLDVEFEPGLTVLTGETGAGKSIVLDALGLALGSRADAGLIRERAEKLSVAASFILPAGHPALTVLADQDLSADDGTVVLRRVIGRDGRSRAFINDQPASVGLLKIIGERLVEIHGQFDTHGLLDPATHLDVLDDYRRATDGAAADDDCRRLHKSWRAAEQAAAYFLEDLRKSVGEEDFIRAAVDELTALAPKVKEEKTLADRRAALKNSDQIQAALADAKAVLAGDVDIESVLRAAQAKVSRVAALAAGRLDEAAKALERAVIEVAEAAAAVERAADDAEAQPGALEKADERLYQLRSAARKHRCTVDELPAVLEKLTGQLADLKGAAKRSTELAAAAAVAKAEFERAARTLHKARAAAAEKLDKAVAKELPPLKLEKARFTTRVEAAEETVWSERGLSRVVFEAATNPGSAPGPLGKIASGGELARFMLALKVVLAATAPPCTMIFDEVDAGISGSTANAVGQRLARLAARVQVFVVTHSAQVAARAAHQWRVSKASRAGSTITRLDPLAPKERREEIARMLSGAKITDEARAAAESLLNGPPS